MQAFAQTAVHLQIVVNRAVAVVVHPVAQLGCAGKAEIMLVGAVDVDEARSYPFRRRRGVSADEEAIAVEIAECEIDRLGPAIGELLLEGIVDQTVVIVVHAVADFLVEGEGVLHIGPLALFRPDFGRTRRDRFRQVHEVAEGQSAVERVGEQNASQWLEISDDLDTRERIAGDPRNDGEHEGVGELKVAGREGRLTDAAAAATDGQRGRLFDLVVHAELDTLGIAKKLVDHDRLVKEGEVDRCQVGVARPVGGDDRACPFRGHWGQFEKEGDRRGRRGERVDSENDVGCVRRQNRADDARVAGLIVRAGHLDADYTPEARLVQTDRVEGVGASHDDIVPAAERGEQPARLLVGRVGNPGDPHVGYDTPELPVAAGPVIVGERSQLAGLVGELEQHLYVEVLRVLSHDGEGQRGDRGGESGNDRLTRGAVLYEPSAEDGRPGDRPVRVEDLDRHGRARRGEHHVRNLGVDHGGFGNAVPILLGQRDLGTERGPVRRLVQIVHERGRVRRRDRHEGATKCQCERRACGHRSPPGRSWGPEPV